MVDALRILRDLLTPRARLKLLVMMCGSVVIAMLDTVAIALVLPLVNIATGQSTDSGATALAAKIVGTDNPQRLTVVLSIVVVTLFILKNFGAMVFNYWLLGFVLIERVRTSARILSFYLTAPYTDVSTRSAAELMRTMDVSVVQVFTYTIGGLMASFASTVAICAVLVALILVAPLPTFALMAYFLIAGGLYLRVAKPRAIRAGRSMNDASVAGWKAAFSALGALKEVNLRASHKHFVEKYREAQLAGSRAGRTAAFLGSLPRYILEMLFILAVGIVLLISGLNETPESGGPLGILALFIAAGFRLLPSITSFLASSSSIKVGADSVGIVRDEVLRARDQAPEAAGDPPLGFERELRVEDVYFRYPGAEDDVLRGVNVSMPFGSSLAVVGGSGAGKTTLVDIMLGLHRPSIGTVRVDGTDIAGRQARWRQNLGYVPQDTYIMDASLLENVAFDVRKDEIDVSKVWDVLEQAQLKDHVLRLPGGLGAQMGERGAFLSGGQRQRIGIARALYQAPRLLVLDEATSSLDNETEHEISLAIKALSGSVSVIVVAHRLSTVRNVDKILFLKEGRIASCGTFDELRQSDTDFARLIRLGSLDADPAGR